MNLNRWFTQYRIDNTVQQVTTYDKSSGPDDPVLYQLMIAYCINCFLYIVYNTPCIDITLSTKQRKTSYC